MSVAAPTGLTATAVSAVRINLAWTNGASYTSMVIQRKIYGGTYATLANLSGHPTSYADTTCAGGTHYVYKILGVIIGSGASAYSNEDDATTATAAPASLTATAATSRKINLAWSNASGGYTGLSISRKPDGGSWSVIKTYTSLVSSYSDDTCADYQKYYYKVTGTGAGASNEANATTPAALSNLRLSVGQSSSGGVITYDVDIAWTAGPNRFTGIHIERMPSGGAWSTWAWVSGSTTTKRDATIGDGIKYYYRVHGYDDSVPGAQGGGSDVGAIISPYTNTVNVTIPLTPPTGLSASSNEAGTSVYLDWNDNSQNEASFKVYQDGVLVATTAANATTKTISGLTPGRTYTFEVRAYNTAAGLSDGTATTITLYPPPNAPSDLTAVGTSISRIQLHWRDNSNDEVDFHIEMSHTGPTSGFNQIGTVEHGVTSYWHDGLDSAEAYWFKVRAHNDVGYSAFSNVALAYTLADISTPTNLTLEVVKVGAVYQVLGKFTDNSTGEDHHLVERKEGVGEYAQILELAANQPTFQDTDIDLGATYTYRVRAQEGAQYSGYCTEVAVTIPDVPAKPAGLAVSEYQDTWVRLSWTYAALIVGYAVEQSDDAGANYTEVFRIREGAATNIRIGGLTADTEYYWKIRAYNAAGYSTYSDPVSQTTRAVYLPTKFERLMRSPSPSVKYLVEINPMLEVTTWTLASGQTYTYEAPFDEGGAAVSAVFENGLALTAKTSIATVEATAGTWWYDPTAAKVYVHTKAEGDPINSFIAAAFWVYFSTGHRGGSTVFNGNNYLPLVAADGIPDINQAIESFYAGPLTIASGTVALINGRVLRQYHFDRRFARYLWLNRKVRILAGGESFTYSEYATINTGLINTVTVTDKRIEFGLRDSRAGLTQTIPSAKYTSAEFPNIAPSSDGKERPYGYGEIVDALPICIDTVRKTYAFHEGRVQNVTAKINGVAKTEGTHFYVDYQLGRLTIDPDVTLRDQDILLVSFTGNVNEADEAVATGAEVFLHICRTWFGLAMEDMDLDSIYEAANASTADISLYLNKPKDAQEIIRTIELTARAYSMPDAEGRLGIRAERTAPESSAPYVWDLHVFDFQATMDQERLYSAVNVYYDVDVQTDAWALVTVNKAPITWKSGVNKTLDLYVALRDEADAQALGYALGLMLDRRQITFSVPRVLFTCLPGDVIYFNRRRFPSIAGSATNVPIRILSIAKLISAGRTEITAEVV